MIFSFLVFARENCLDFLTFLNSDTCLCQLLTDPSIWTQSNAKFALTVEPQNGALQSRAEKVKELRQKGLPTVSQNSNAVQPFLSQSVLYFNFAQSVLYFKLLNLSISVLYNLSSGIPHVGSVWLMIRFQPHYERRRNSILSSGHSVPNWENHLKCQQLQVTLMPLLQFVQPRTEHKRSDFIWLLLDCHFWDEGKQFSQYPDSSFSFEMFHVQCCPPSSRLISNFVVLMTLDLCEDIT